jgi:hypothetical protein
MLDTSQITPPISSRPSGVRHRRANGRRCRQPPSPAMKGICFLCAAAAQTVVTAYRRDQLSNSPDHRTEKFWPETPAPANLHSN